MNFPYMTIAYNTAKFRIQIFVEEPQPGEYSIKEILAKFQQAGYECRLGQHGKNCSKPGIPLHDYDPFIFPEILFDKEGQAQVDTGRNGYFINMCGGYYKMPSKKDPTKTRFEVLEMWIAKLQMKRPQYVPQIVDHHELDPALV